MINEIRNTVLSILNKNNYGYISPSDFNLLAKNAQMDIFNQLFFDLNYNINKENVRQSGSGYADIKKQIEEEIDGFSVTSGLRFNSDNIYLAPSAVTTGSSAHLINKVLVYETVLATGTTTSFDPGFNLLIDINASFLSTVSVGDIVAIDSSGIRYLKIISVDSDTQLTMDSVLFTAFPIVYSIYSPNGKKNEAERVSHNKSTLLINSLDTTPSITFPAYTLSSANIEIFPVTISQTGRVLAQYIRYPNDPKWTFISLGNGEPIFDQSAPDYQDFELSNDSFIDLVVKICQYCGITIREGDVYQFAQSEETESAQKQS